MDDPALRALAVNEALAALGNERFEADGATFIRNRDTPDIWDANHVTRVTASTPAEIDRLLERVEREYGGFAYRQFWVDFTTPPAVEARLAHDGYRLSPPMLVMVLEGEPCGQPRPHDIRPVESESGWRDYAALHEVDWREYAGRMPEGTAFNEETARQMMLSRRGKSPPLRYWMAYVDKKPAAYLASWSGVDGVGQVEDLFTHPEFRNRGLARALIHHGVAAAREDGAGPVILVADPTDTPKEMYAAIGFQPVAVKREYQKRLGT